MKINNRFNLLVVLMAGCFCACTPSKPGLISDAQYRAQVEADFRQKQKCLPQGDFFAWATDASYTDFEREALTFLYAYMPTADITDYPSSFHLSNVRASLLARQEMPWGKQIPETEFRHFVLPVRVNNEHLDSARMVFYSELKPRVEKLSLKEAILEVNHWCHEKAVYTPSDARTSSPLATVRTAYGRCGEESTFLVAALRSVGIPARQVYTPRWAHTDDNHAWVEAWADGHWYFLGACEPEPVLNLGWFNAPASRGMLMHTKVFGRYNGTEEVMSRTPNYTEINIIDNYALTAVGRVMVVDTQGQPVPDALVEYKIYNYAEFYTVARKQTDLQGQSSLTAGRGDMLVWASKNGRYGFAKLAFGKEAQATVVLDKQENDVWQMDFDITPPAEKVNLPPVTDEQRAENDRRMFHEDDIRNAYVATMMDEDEAMDWVERTFAETIDMPQKKELTDFLVKSRGNHAVIVDFLTNARGKRQAIAFALLRSLSEKDLRDVRPTVLNDHLTHALSLPQPLDELHVLCPRISVEELTPYKSFFRKVITPENQQRYAQDPLQWVAWCKCHISLNDTLNSQRIPMTPIGVWKSQVADHHSRDIFFIAVLRSLGVPAWIDGVTGRIYYQKGEVAYQVNFKNEADHEVEVARGTVKAGYKPTKVVDNPKYYTHFSLSQLREGSPRLMEYDERNTTWQSLLQSGSLMETGNYLLTTGMRLASGGVLAHLSTFQVADNRSTQTELVMREDSEAVQVIGNFNAENLYTPITLDVGQPSIQKHNPASLLHTCGRGYYVLGLIGVNQEPTNHALRDIAALSTQFENWGRGIVLLFANETDASGYLNFLKKKKADGFPELPATIAYGIDSEGISEILIKDLKLRQPLTLPVFIIADSFNRVVYISQGYTIGLGEQIMNTVKGIQSF